MAKPKKHKAPKKPPINKRQVAKITFEGGPKHGQTGEYDVHLNRQPLKVNMARDEYRFTQELPPTKAIPHWKYEHTPKG